MRACIFATFFVLASDVEIRGLNGSNFTELFGCIVRTSRPANAKGLAIIALCLMVCAMRPFHLLVLVAAFASC